jgi:starvation-inducible DNA-binding protein
MHKTRNDLPEPVRVKLCTLLNERLADGIDLMMQAKQAHWNVKGPSFIALHELFDKVVDNVGEHVDDLAERVMQLGGTAEGTVRVAAKRSSLSEYPLELDAGRGHAEALATALAAFGKAVRHAIKTAADLDDADTADLFTEISRGIDKDLWFVEAHLQAKE